MKASELYEKVSNLTGIDSGQTSRILGATFAILKEHMVKGEEVDIQYFGTFKTKFYGSVRLPAFIPSRDLRLIVKYNLYHV